MSLLREVLAELLGMFLADARLSVAVLVLVGAVAVMIDGFGVPPLAGGAVLLLGCLAILGAVTTATSRRR